jgi:DNA polymerase-3 subunit beta
LEGVLFEQNGEEFSLVGTDGNRLSSVQFPAKCGQSSAIVPAAAARQIQRSLSSGACSIRISDNAISIESEGILIWSRLVEGRFPKWREHYAPDAFPGDTFDVHAPALLAAIQQVSLACNETSVGVMFTLSEGSLKLEAESADLGKSDAEIHIASSLKAKARLNPHYVADYLKLVGDQSITVQIDKTKPAFFGNGKPEYAVMPLKL